MKRLIAFVTRHPAMFASLSICVVLVAMTKSPFGELFSALTDHFHHMRMTWTFLHVGFDIYTKPFGETAALAPFRHGGATWDQFPMAYPPGMLAIFLPLTLLGAYTSISSAALGKTAVLYLTGFMHGALGIISSLIRRMRSAF